MHENPWKWKHGRINCKVMAESLEKNIKEKKKMSILRKDFKLFKYGWLDNRKDARIDKL